MPIKQIVKGSIERLKAVLAPAFDQYSRHLPYIITTAIALVVVVGSINLFVELTDGLKEGELSAIDSQITDYIISFRTPARTEFFIWLTHVGDIYGYLIIGGIFIFLSAVVFKSWKYIAQIGIVLILATLSNMMLKRFIDRARPDIEHLVSVATLSYPSGHAMSAMAFYGFLIYLLYRFKMNRFLKVAAIIFFILLILNIGISRVYLGVHFPTDIIAGFIAGFIWVVFCVLAFNLIELFRRDPQT
ncbi:phosphatase PAP2 family protein [Pricia sp. S334]|uniref:Phosphatase PAP2 family protein n=1 Tax=Pricia mediterranea TaxID=3076079 RepID=A0ABU3L2L3_9FLAO|nr:phosphatase PAP2 family protein [Pricia sp. S334]MDT7827424.1 phosphatase PAP2 family protein [Pricia sp. S334]